MNEIRNLLKRLIKLYPIKILKSHFNKSDKQKPVKKNVDKNDIYDEIIDSNHQTDVKNFAYTNINFTKQHVYIFSISKFKLNKIDLKDFPFSVIENKLSPTALNLVISPIVDFKVSLNNPFEEKNIQFHQPCIITLNETHLIIQITILEKNIGTYFEVNRKVLDIVKENDEDVTLQKILTYFNSYNPKACDINRGVKHLWEHDNIDSKYVKWKKNRSTTTESMDENYTLKKQYPEEYKSLITSPLNKTIFKYLKQDEKLPSHFATNPSDGEISISIYSKNANQVNNIVTEILKNNK